MSKKKNKLSLQVRTLVNLSLDMKFKTSQFTCFSILQPGLLNASLKRQDKKKKKKSFFLINFRKSINYHAAAVQR